MGHYCHSDQTLSRALLGLLVWLWVGASGAAAATINAANCTESAVQAAITSASNGDTVVLPVCTVNWTTPVTVSGKWITVQGSGITQTIITDTRASGYDPSLFTWTVQAGGLSRLTGIRWNGNTNGSSGGNVPTVIFLGTTTQLRVDHLYVLPGVHAGLMVYHNITGVVDHVTFDVSRAQGFGLYVFHGKWNDDGSELEGYGDASWEAADTLGTAAALYVEDCTFTNNQSVNYHEYGNDGWAGSRVVYRKNTYTNVTWANHGLESSGRYRSQRQFEAYQNTFSFANPSAFPSLIGSRGGVGYVWGNVATTTGGTVGSVVDLEYQRVGASFAPWGQCNGTAAYDENQAGQAGYRCLDQPGSGQQQLAFVHDSFPPSPAAWRQEVLQPNYAWSNTLNGSNSALVSNRPTHIVANRDYYDFTAAFTGATGVGVGGIAARPSSCTPGVGYWATDEGTWDSSHAGADGRLYRCTAPNTWTLSYTPYAYPHPLVTGASAPPTVTITTDCGSGAGVNCAVSTTPFTTLAGIASDDVAVTAVTWACPTCTPASGTATGTSSWTVASLGLGTGANTITVTAIDADSQTATDTLTVTLTAPPTAPTVLRLIQ